MSMVNIIQSFLNLIEHMPIDLHRRRREVISNESHVGQSYTYFWYERTGCTVEGLKLANDRAPEWVEVYAETQNDEKSR